VSPPRAPGPHPDGWTVETQVHFRTGVNGRKGILEGGAPPPLPVIPGRVPRVTRLLALAHRFRALLGTGEVADYADLSRLAGVTRPRITQIMNLLLLAPDIQEAILDLPRVLEGLDPVTERVLRPIASVPNWAEQREMWRALPGPDSERVPLDVSPPPRPHVSGGVAMGAPPKRRSR
jgi:hypothetical protein